MNIKKIDIEYATKNGFHSNKTDGIRHTKILPYLSVVQAVEGNYDIQLGNDKVHNTKNSGFFIAPSNIQQIITHHEDKKSRTMHCRWVFLKIKINNVYIFDYLHQFPAIIPEPFKTQMNHIFDKLFSTNNKFSEYVCYYEIAELLSLIAEEKEYRLPLFLDDAITYIKNNYREKITIEEISAKCNISASYLFSAFKKYIGVSPISYLNQYRLSIAAEELLDTSKNICEISQNVGIYDSIYFNKIFKKQYQMSPTEYRKQYIVKLAVKK